MTILTPAVYASGNEQNQRNEARKNEMGDSGAVHGIQLLTRAMRTKQAARRETERKPAN